MRVAYFTPVNPIRSGISDFAEELLLPMSESMEITLFVDAVTPSNPELKGFPCFDISAYEQMRDLFDLAVFQAGNDARCHERIIEAFLKYGGVLELHDVAMHHYLAGTTVARGNRAKYLHVMTYCHGKEGRQAAEAFFGGRAPAPWEYDPLRFTTTKHLIDRAAGVIVHSDMAKQMVLGVRPTVPVVNIIHHAAQIIADPEQYRQECRKKLGIPESCLVFGSFGIATRPKRILEILEALHQFHQRNKMEWLYVVVGAAQQDLGIPQLLKKYDLENHVRVTGFADLEDFKTYMGACDFCLNLRYPTLGESSGSFHRMLGIGIPSVVTDIGTFREYPDAVSWKVRYDDKEVSDIYQAISKLAGDPEEREKRSQASMKFAREYCDIHKNAKRYEVFFHQLLTDSWKPEYADHMIGNLCEVGLTGEEYLRHFMQQAAPCLAHW